MTEDILAKVRKILAKADDPAATLEESETYTAKAAELIAHYGIDRALLAQGDPDSDIVGDRVVVLDAPYALDKASLLAVVSHRLRCRSVQRTDVHAGRRQVSLHLFGYDSDLLRCELLFTSLLLQATTNLARTPVPYGESAAAFRRSWLAGFAGAVGRRLADSELRAERQAEDQAEASTSAAGRRSVAVVLADRSVAVGEAMRDRYPHLGRAQPRRLSGSGGRAGWAAGQQADLGGRSSRLHRRPRGRISR